MLLFLQNGVTVILLLINYYFFPSGSESFPKINYEILKIWIPVVLLFVTMLCSSLFALIYVSVPTLIVIRNLSTLSVAVLEYFILDNKVDILSIGTLIGMLLGAIFYSMHDLTFNIKGYMWLCVNIIGTSLYQIYIKKVINMSIMKDHGAISMSYYNNLISLPILLILSFLMGEFKSLLIYFQSIYLPKIRSICIVFLSCILGFALSTSAFSLNKEISPTSMMVANNVNKFSLIVLSEIIIEWTLDIRSSIGAIFVLFCGCLYSQTKEYFAKYLFFFATILFLTLYTSLESKHLIIQMINQKFFSGFNFVTQSNMSFFKNMTNLFNNESKIISID
jgi:GDP-mannose transporter